MYIVAQKAVEEIHSKLTVEDVQDLIFGLDRDSMERVKKLLSGETTSLLNFEDSVLYAIQSCGCGKNELKEMLQIIVGIIECEDEGIYNESAMLLLKALSDQCCSSNMI